MKDSLLSELATIQLGYQSRTKLEKDTGSDYSVLMGKDISKDNELNLTKLMKVRKEAGIQRYLLQQGDVLFMAKGAYNYAVCLDREIPSTVASNSFYIIRINSSGIEPCYLAWWLNQSAAAEYFTQNRSTGITISFITAEALRSTPVRVPELTTQKRIISMYELFRTYKQKSVKLLELQENLIYRLTYMAISQEEKE